MNILFRNSIETEEEFRICSSILPTKEQRTKLDPGLVIGRYSVLPYYTELEKDLATKGCKLINSYHQHNWIANFDYYEVLKDYTFETWFDIKDTPDVPMVVKGRTNSRKARWDTHMFAKNREQALLIALELLQDPLLQNQGIIYRRYVPLQTLEIGINNQPFANEFRFFFLGKEVLSYAFYWTQCERQGEMDGDGLTFAINMGRIISNYVNFFVIDIAKTEDGKWVLVEVNDGQMSGLSHNDPSRLYSNLRDLSEEYISNS